MDKNNHLVAKKILQKNPEFLLDNQQWYDDSENPKKHWINYNVFLASLGCSTFRKLSVLKRLCKTFDGDACKHLILRNNILYLCPNDLTVDCVLSNYSISPQLFKYNALFWLDVTQAWDLYILYLHHTDQDLESIVRVINLSNQYSLHLYKQDHANGFRFSPNEGAYHFIQQLLFYGDFSYAADIIGDPMFYNYSKSMIYSRLNHLLVNKAILTSILNNNESMYEFMNTCPKQIDDLCLAANA